MGFLGIQIIAVFFAIFMIYVSFLHYKKDEISSFYFLIWFLLWLGFCFFAIFPFILNPVIRYLKIFRVMDLIMIIAFMVLTFSIFECNVRAQKIERRLEKIVRRLAIEGYLKRLGNVKLKNSKKDKVKK